MKVILRVLIFILFSVSAKAQFVQITNTTGTSAYGTLNVTVTPGGYCQTWGSWCTTMYGTPPTYTSYWVGESAAGSGAGWYTFTLSHAVSGIKAYSYAINGAAYGTGEYLEMYINGSPYSFTPADITNYADCASGAGTVCYLYTLGSGTTVAMGPVPPGDYSGVDFIHMQTGITSFELYSNGNLAGVTFYVFVDTAGITATVNTPCLGSSLDFNTPGDSVGATYVWLGPNSWTTTVATTQSFTITPSVWSDTGTYHIIKTVGTAIDTASIHVTLNYAAPIAGTPTMCVGGTTSLSDAITGGTWSSSNTGIATVNATTGIVTGVSVGTCDITYTTPAGCTATIPVNVIILSPITGTMTVCQGSTTTLAESAGTTTWTSSNTLVATIGATTGVVTGISGGTANVTFTTGTGCYTTATVTVNPTSPITGNVSICQYFTTNLADALVGGTWHSGNPGVATINGSGLVYGATAGTATISYTSIPGCLMTTVVTVHPKPAPPVANNPVVCQFNPTSLSATPAAGQVWYGPGLTAGTVFPPTPSTTTPGVTDYWVTDSTSFGCISDSTKDSVTVIPQPAPPVATNSMYCQYSPVAPLNFQVDSSAGSHLTWYNTLTGGAPYAGVPPVSNLAATYPTGTTWYVSQTINGCPSNRIPVTVTIVYKPSFSIIASRYWVCDHDTLTFAYSPTAPLIEGSFRWEMTPGLTIIRGSDTSQAITVRFDTVYGQHYVSLTVGELNNMCSTTDSAQISVIALPSTTAYMKPNICLGDTTTLALSNESSTASIFSWFVDGIPLTSTGAVSIVAASSNNGGPYSLSWNDTGLHIITVMCTTSQGCKSEPTYDSVDVHALPDAAFTFKPKFNNVLCLEDSVQFIATYPEENNSYLWQPAHSFNNDNKPVIWGKVEETQSDITLTVTDPFGCVGTFTQQLDPSSCCTVMFPNAFTPNGDTKNDVFRPLFNGYHNFHYFRIANRWGQTVFESSNSLPAWDGTFNGVPQDIGIYYYYIQYDCGGSTVEAKGDVTLIR